MSEAREPDVAHVAEIADVAALAAALRLAGEGEAGRALERLADHSFAAGIAPAAAALQAQLLESEGHGAEAWDVLERALERSPGHAALLVRAGVLAYHRGDLVRAADLLARAWRAGPLPEAAFHLGEIAVLQGSRVEAARWLALCAAFDGAGGGFGERARQRLAADPAPGEAGE